MGNPFYKNIESTTKRQGIRPLNNRQIAHARPNNKRRNKDGDKTWKKIRRREDQIISIQNT
jgi:hypothetical protein